MESDEVQFLRAERDRYARLLGLACAALNRDNPMLALGALALLSGENLERPAFMCDEVDADGFAWAETADGRYAKIALVDDA